MMLPCYLWQSRGGTLAPDNRDYCGIAEAYGTNLCILADGATGTPHSGELARALVCHFLESFKRTQQSLTSEGAITLLKQAHGDLRRQYPADSASYIVAFKTDDPIINTIHAGDCRLGRVTQNRIQWLTPVHTLATAIQNLEDHVLRADPNRYLLTRSFKGRRFQEPECNIHKLDDKHEVMVLASDGFWADLEESKQLDLLSESPLEMKAFSDDTSCLRWSFFETQSLKPLSARCTTDSSIQNLILA
jgi:serine/threonine protein phosphatase PrpC